MSSTTFYEDIFAYITSMEAQYKLPIPLEDSWDWSMREHIRLTYLYTNAQLSTGKSDYKPVKNITLPILNLQHRTEDIDVKDVQIYVDDPEDYHLSFLVKKYHDDVFVEENDMDTYFDELNVSRIDYGAGLSKKLNKPCPEVVPMQTIAFCDQSDILSGPIGIKHYFSPDQLLEMGKKGWGSKANGATATLEETIVLSREEKKEDPQGRPVNTPGRYIEVYEVHGNVPKRFAKPTTSEEYETRFFAVCFYKTKEGKKEGLILFTALEEESPFMVIKRDPIHGRALGRGAAEELFEPQVWVNYDMIRLQDMLDAAAKTVLKATGPNSTAIATKNKLKNMDNLEIIDVGPDSDLGQVDTYPRNLRLFEKSIQDWEMHAKDLGNAQDPIQGKEPVSGTPFKSLEEQIRQGMGMHEYRRKQFAKHIEIQYRKWLIPEFQKEIVKGKKFLSELSIEDMQYVSDCIVRNAVSEYQKEQVLNGEPVLDDQGKKEYEERIREEIRKGGSKRFIEILKGEFKKKSLAVKVSVAGSKRLSELVDKAVNIFRFAFANPQGFAQVMQIPGMAKSFNQILEYSGLSPADFSGIEKLANPPQPQPVPGQPQPSPMQAQPQMAQV